MTTQQFRLFIAVLLVAVLAFAGLIVWQQTHKPKPDCYIGSLYFAHCPR